MVDYHYVTERLAVGGVIRNVECMRTLAADGFTHVINMMHEFDDHAINDGTGIQVLQNGTTDDFLPKPTSLFWKGVEFALEALENPQAKVYVHCAAGVHRSPIMVLAILRALGVERKQAINMITDARPVANFPPVYVMSVEDFMREFRAASQNTK
jgi:protein-tyrosine phosphatase